MLLNGRDGKAIPLEIVPGRKTPPIGVRQVSHYVIAEIIATGEPGACRVEARLHNKMVPVTSKMAKALGLGASTDTLRRLIKAGFIKGCRFAPRVYLLDLDSYHAHLALLQRHNDEGTEFWTPERLARYRSAL